jgi:MSHA biogenesis protein MshP
MAIFIIIVISMLGMSLVSMQRDSAEGTSYEVYAARAYLAAYSASEMALIKLFPLGTSEASAAACTTTEQTVTLPDDSNTVGFHGCSAGYKCSTISGKDGSNTRYRIVSTATCQTNLINTRRQITVEATSL